MNEVPRLRQLTAESGTPPFLKWLGGKRWLIRNGVYIPTLDADAGYFEPFLGGSSLFFAAQPSRATLSDVNTDLIVTYRALRDHVEDVIRCLSEMPSDLHTYNRVRLARPSGQVERAARFVYLNRTAYGGIYRVNAAGVFNVPYGHYRRNVYQPAVLRRCAAALATATIRTSDFRTATKRARPGDFVYFDPPYSAHGAVEVFGRYHARPFDWAMHERLARAVLRLSDQGTHVLVSNSSHPDVVALYPGMHLTTIKRPSVLSRNLLGRHDVEELLISSYAMPK